MSKQKLFDEALTHIRKQGCQSEINGVCQYDDGNGHSCAFAPAIKVKITPKINSKTASYFYDLKDDIHEYLHGWAINAGKQLAIEIQSCHDSFDEDNSAGQFLPYFEAEMMKVAERHDLIYEPV